MKTTKSLFWYIMSCVVVGVIVVLPVFLPALEPILKWATPYLALMVALWGLIHTVSLHERQAIQDRPDITGLVTGIEFIQSRWAESPHDKRMGIPGILFSLDVRNRGNQETTITECWLVLEGQSRDQDAHSLVLQPGRTRICARAQEQMAVRLLHDSPEAFRNLNARLILRDASDREYDVRVDRIAPGFRAQRIADLPVREE